MDLSAHFTLERLTFSETAIRLGIDNTPTELVIQNLRKLAAKLEAVMVLLNAPLDISSGYRCDKLNVAVGGVPGRSQHLLGLAADFICPKFGNPYKIATFIKDSDLEYDQLILEYGRWVHLSVAADGSEPRKMLLTKKANVAGYLKGIVL